MGINSEKGAHVRTEKENVDYKAASVFLMRMEINKNDFEILKTCLFKFWHYTEMQ